MIPPMENRRSRHKLCSTAIGVVVLTYLGLSAVLHPFSAFAQAGYPLTLEAAQVIESDSPRPPREDAGWQQVELPFAVTDVQAQDMETALSYWFRVRLPDAQPQGLRITPSLYIPRHNFRIRVFLEEDYVGGSTQGRYGQAGITWNYPLLIDLPTDYGSAETLFIHLESGPSGPILSPLTLGNRADLLDAYEDRLFWQVTSSRWSFVICLVMGVLALWLWRRRPQDSLYLRLAGMCFCWAVALTFSFLDFIPGSLRLWLFFVHSAFDWGSYLMISFTLLAIGLPAPRLCKLLLINAIIATLTHLLVPDQYFFLASLPFQIVETLAVLGLTLMIFWHTLRQRESTSFWFSAAFIGIALLMLHDFYVVFLVSEEEWLNASNWTHLSLPLLAVAFYAHLLTRFVNALDDSEQLNRELEARVESSRQELELSYAENREMEIENAANEERGKIYRDLHDDVGSKLASILHKNPESDSGHLARSALESLRAAIFRANFKDPSIQRFFESMDEELAIRASSAGLGYSFDNKLAGETGLSAEMAYHLARIFRELFSNVLHHARAENIEFHVCIKEDKLVCELADDGVGFDDSISSRGGIANIHYRVNELAGQVSWIQRTPGTVASLTVPLPS